MNTKVIATSPLKEALSACRLGFAAVAVFSLCINLLVLTVPIYMLQLFDRVLSSRSTDTLVMLLLIAAVALLVMAALDGVRSILLIRISAWLDNQLGGAVLMESIAGALRGREATVQGLRDIGTVRTFLSGPSIFPILDAPWTPIFIAVVFLLHPLVGWVALGGAIVLFALAAASEFTTRDTLMRAGGAAMGA